ncbi:MAG TPA: hypothetical protein PLL64_02405 [Rhodothermales bacterium]|nr:hypothetical protein [Bacteroidota bacterium]HRK73099.1 hypothetical protein [Rhodothermales bacterium]HRR09133.1 hypothetical protein [Rhodothermales bacterium]
MKTVLYRFFSVVSIGLGIVFIAFGLYQFSQVGKLDLNWVALGVFGFVFPFALRWFLLETD